MEKPSVTVAELKRSYINLPETLFTRRMTANEFGAATLLHLKTEGLGLGPVKMLGYAFFIGLSPVEIAVYGCLCNDPAATAKQIAKSRKLTERIVKRATEALYDVGLIVGIESGSYVMTTLADLDGDQPVHPEPVATETAAAQPDETVVPAGQNEPS